MHKEKDSFAVVFLPFTIISFLQFLGTYFRTIPYILFPSVRSTVLLS